MRTDVIRKETLRYLGLGSAEPDEKTLEMVREQGSGAIDEARALSAALTDAGVAAEAVVS